MQEDFFIMKMGFTIGMAMGSVATFALLQKNKINRLLKKAK